MKKGKNILSHSVESQAFHTKQQTQVTFIDHLQHLRVSMNCFLFQISHKTMCNSGGEDIEQGVCSKESALPTNHQNSPWICCLKMLGTKIQEYVPSNVKTEDDSLTKILPRNVYLNCSYRSFLNFFTSPFVDPLSLSIKNSKSHQKPKRDTIFPKDRVWETPHQTPCDFVFWHPKKGKQSPTSWNPINKLRGI